MTQSILSKEFQAEAIARLKSGESLTGKDGILTPLIKQIIEASLEGELDAHLAEKRACKSFCVNALSGEPALKFDSESIHSGSPIM